jgi:EAL domain-containing protein (putative c-di-GMP-specific phosphodiesterase class I)
VGGDEFAVLVKPGNDPAAITDLAERIIAATRKPYTIGEHRAQVTISVGIARPTAEMNEPDDLLRWADIAMYRAKSNGKNRYDIFDPEMHASALRRMELQHELARAIDHDELMLHYQPEISLATGGIVGFEALVRWEHPVHGLIPPCEFIPLAEETGLIVPLGVWVLNHACRQMQAWRAQSPLMAGLTLSVNLSAKQFQTFGLVDEVWKVLAATGLPSDSLILEITESAMMNDLDVTGRLLQALTSLGVRLAIDDFGMGYSSLAQVQRFPLDVLKIDRQFVDDLGVELEGTVIVSGIISLAHALGISVVAEGVETVAQVEQLRALGCDIAQGFHFSKPMPPDQVEAYARSCGVMTVQAGDGQSPSREPLRDTGDLHESLAELVAEHERVRDTEQRLAEAIRDLRFRLGQSMG